MNCPTCIHYKHYNEYGGMCHRYPPQMISTQYAHQDGHQIEQHQPFVTKDDHCGEYKDNAAHALAKTEAVNKLMEKET